MNFAELDAAAKVAAATVPDWFQDVRQEAWVRFLRYRPRTIGGARMMAFSARNDLLKKERTQRGLAKRIATGVAPIALAASACRKPGTMERRRAHQRAYDKERQKTPKYREYRRLYMQAYRA